MQFFKNLINKIKTKLIGTDDSHNPYDRIHFKDLIDDLGIVKSIAWGVVIFLVISDYYTLFDLFSSSKFDILNSFAHIIAITCAMFLEGLPYIMGDGLNRLLSKQKKKNTGDRKKTWIVFIVGLVSSIFIMCALVGFRIEVILLSIGAEKTQIVEILKGAGTFGEKFKEVFLILTFGLEKSDQVAVNIYLALQPILTSILAFMVSFTYLSDESIDTGDRRESLLKKKVQRARLKNDANRRILERAKLDLLSDLGIDNNSEHWTNLDDAAFIRDVFQKITNKVITMSANGYVRAVKKYNVGIEAQLAAYLSVIATKSNLPHRITGINIQNIIQKYDNNHKKMNVWEADTFIAEASKVLQSSLYNDRLVNIKRKVPTEDPTESNLRTNTDTDLDNDADESPDEMFADREINNNTLANTSMPLGEETEDEVGKIEEKETYNSGKGSSINDADQKNASVPVTPVQAVSPQTATHKPQDDDFLNEYDGAIPPINVTPAKPAVSSADPQGDDFLNEYDGAVPPINVTPVKPAVSSADPQDDDFLNEYDGAITPKEKTTKHA
ncbi:MAG: hypothetical protein IKJ69_04105 [Clostridia bacterium]|nr:hypothetical protein [Clostridia bacterium]